MVYLHFPFQPNRLLSQGYDLLPAFHISWKWTCLSKTFHRISDRAMHPVPLPSNLPILIPSSPNLLSCVTVSSLPLTVVSLLDRYVWSTTQLNSSYRFDINRCRPCALVSCNCGHSSAHAKPRVQIYECPVTPSSSSVHHL